MPTPTADSNFVESSPLRKGVRRAEPLVWLSAGSVLVSMALLIALVGLLALRALPHFWPAPLLLIQSDDQGPTAQLGESLDARSSLGGAEDLLLHRGGEDLFGSPLVWIDERRVRDRTTPLDAIALDRDSLGPVFGFLVGVESHGERRDLTAQSVAQQVNLVRVLSLASEDGPSTVLTREATLATSFQVRLASGRVISIPATEVRNVYAPNAMTTMEKVGHFFSEVGRFLGESPSRSNVQGGVFPAIVGTVTLVLLMTILVSPLGVLAAIFLQEYAQRGPITRIVRIAVNNLAGVPSIVYGVFGLGFFVYAVGGSLDAIFYADTLPAPTLGAPGMLWAALTMALLTLPVVIVSTEEGLARVPSVLREGSLALGATRAESLWRVVIPAASPAVLTGLILAIARATGEVAPLLLVGVAKYAPGLPVSGEYPFLHLDRQFMHLGFYIYDLGFQSPHLETAEGLVYATALLLVTIVLLLNLAAVMLRGRLREAFKAEET